jgi:hypothetical protein
VVGFAVGVDVGVEVGVGFAVGAELGIGVGVAKDVSLVVMIAYIPESPHKFKKLVCTHAIIILHTNQTTQAALINRILDWYVGEASMKK